MKKKLVLLGLIAFMLFSCAKPTEDGMTTIRIGHRYVESGSFCATRSEIAPNIDDALSAIMPTSVPLTLARDVFTTFYCASGEEITLPYNCEYAVKGASAQIKTEIRDGAWASKEPLVVIDDTIHVTYGKKEYIVNASIASFALVWNNKLVEYVTFLNELGEEQVLPSYSYGDTSICCITGSLGDTPLTIVLHTWEGQPWKPRLFELTTSPDGTGIRCESGKWYALSPYVITEESGTISLDCSWSSGGNYY